MFLADHLQNEFEEIQLALVTHASPLLTHSSCICDVDNDASAVDGIPGPGRDRGLGRHWLNDRAHTRRGGLSMETRICNESDFVHFKSCLKADSSFEWFWGDQFRAPGAFFFFGVYFQHAGINFRNSVLFYGALGNCGARV